MKLRVIGLLAAVALLGSSAMLRAGEPTAAELAKELTGEKPAAERTAEQLAAAYVKVLDSLMPNMGVDDPGPRGQSQGAIERIAFHACRPGAEASRLACAKALAGKLGDDVPVLARVWIIRQIERIGRAEVVPQLAAAMGDKEVQVRESARRALLKNPSKEANAAFLTALAAAGEPEWRIALINALAEHRDPSNLAALLKDAASGNDDVRSAAIVALAKVGDKSAVEAIAAGMAKGPEEAKRIATDSYLLLADALAAKGDKTTALGMYRKMAAGEGYLKCAGIIGLGRAGGAAELPAIFETLGDADIRLRASAVEALGMMSGKDVTEAIVAKAKVAAGDQKAMLLRALAQRGDRGAAALFAAACDDADEAVKAEAVRGLGMAGDASAVPVLLKLAAAAGKSQDAARASLERIKAPGVDQALLTAMNEKDPKARAEVIRALASRRVTAATAALLKAAEDSDAALRGEAIKALGVVGQTVSLPAVAALLVKAADDASRNEAANSLFRIASREANADKRAEPILRALASAGGPAKLSLLGVLGRLGGGRSLLAVRAAAKDKDEQVREAAIRALADWPDDDAAADLLEIAKSGPNETLQVIAIRGYIRIARMRDVRSPAESAKMLAAGLEAAKRAEEKRQALSGLAEIREVSSFQAVVPCLSDGALKGEAARAAVRIARDIWERNPQPVKAAMEKVLEVSKDQDTRKQAQEVLDRIAQKQK